MTQDKEFDTLLIRYRRFEPASSDLAERIALAAHMRAQKRTFSPGGWLAELFSILLPKPACVAAAAFVLGIGVGVSIPMVSPQDNGDDFINYVLYTDKGEPA
jgi:hypothetical protein